mmetsp:Transcript_20697/g.53663  ORF Transcript_20697/g.53663 Transcript_20697/m.53663 type:complete len:272 (+) Transcript_20697:666-1481(+)
MHPGAHAGRRPRGAAVHPQQRAYYAAARRSRPPGPRHPWRGRPSVAAVGAYPVARAQGRQPPRAHASHEHARGCLPTHRRQRQERRGRRAHPEAVRPAPGPALRRGPQRARGGRGGRGAGPRLVLGGHPLLDLQGAPHHPRDQPRVRQVERDRPRGGGGRTGGPPRESVGPPRPQDPPPVGSQPSPRHLRKGAPPLRDAPSTREYGPFDEVLPDRPRRPPHGPPRRRCEPPCHVQCNDQASRAVVLPAERRPGHRRGPARWPLPILSQDSA